MTRHQKLFSPGGSRHPHSGQPAAGPYCRRQPRAAFRSAHSSAAKPTRPPRPLAAPAPFSTAAAPAPPQKAPHSPPPFHFQFAFPFTHSPESQHPPQSSTADAIRNLRQGLECGVATATEALRRALPPSDLPASFPILEDSARCLAIKALGQEIAATPSPAWKGLLLLRAALQQWHQQPPNRRLAAPPPHPGVVAARKVYADWIDRGLIDPSLALLLSFEKAVLDICATPWPCPQPTSPKA